SPKSQSSNRLRRTAKTPTRHKVKQGETLSSIASSYKTTVAAMRHDNGNLATLRPGMILLIRDVKEPTTEPLRPRTADVGQIGHFLCRVLSRKADVRRTMSGVRCTLRRAQLPLRLGTRG